MFTVVKMLSKKPMKTVGYILDKYGFVRMDDRDYVEYCYYKINDGAKLNLDSPKTFTDKLNWMKINGRREIYTTMADKYKVKELVSDKIGKEYVVPLIRDSHGGGI